jgi:hypothetical protein
MRNHPNGPYVRVPPRVRERVRVPGRSCLPGFSQVPYKYIMPLWLKIAIIGGPIGCLLASALIGFCW